MTDRDTDADDPLERRRRQREANRRRNLSVLIVGGGLVIAGLVVAVVVLVKGKGGLPVVVVGAGEVPNDPAGHKPEGVVVTSGKDFVEGQVVTVEGEVTNAHGGHVRNGEQVIMFVKCHGKTVMCVFGYGANGERWHHDTRRGDLLKVTGVVREAYERKATLEDCKFVGQVLRK